LLVPILQKGRFYGSGALSVEDDMRKKVEEKAKLNGNGHGDGQNTVQGFVFGINLKGTENVVMEGIKAFTTAMALSGTTFVPAVKRHALDSGDKQQNVIAATGVIDVEEPDNTVEEIPEEESTIEAAEETSRNGNGTERKKRIPPTPNLVPDLDITAEPMPFKTFLEQKGPRMAQDRMAVVATWLKKHRNYQEISRDHFYSVYQQMGGSGDWKCLNNWDVLIRQLAKRKSWFERGTNEASYKVSIVATNYVDAMTPTGA
jgi:hypothetical protein